jgi:membrane protein DedA with SNARE-associated domain/membrane-associated phospholipid phosphatase
MAWLAHYGYIALALGVFAESAAVPVPGETLLLAAGALTTQGHLSLVKVIIVAAAAGITGDNLGFFLGRRLGRGWLARHGRRILLPPSRLRHMDAFFERFGPLAVVVARFVAGVRVVAAFVAGSSRMHWRTFLIFNVIGAAAWATVVALVGVALGRGYRALAGATGHVGIVVVAVAVTVGAGVWALRRYRHREEAGEMRGEVGAPALTFAALLRRAGSHIVFAFGAGACATWAFLALTEEVAEGDTAKFDLLVRGWTLAHRSPLLDAIARVATWAGSPFVLGVGVAVFAWWLWRRGGRAAAALMIFAPAAASLLLLLAARSLHRSGPGGALGAMPKYSFPGGVGTASAAVAATLAYLLLRERLAPRLVVPAAALYVLVVGASSIYLDIHWATDVVAGWALGLGIAMLSAVVYEQAKAGSGLES